MDLPPRIYFRYPFGQHLGSVDGTACRGNTGDQDVHSIGLEDFLDSSPMCDLQWSNGWPDSHRVKTKKAVTKYDRILWGEIWKNLSGVHTTGQIHRMLTFPSDILPFHLGVIVTIFFG